jgi:hypothetical protein
MSGALLSWIWVSKKINYMMTAYLAVIYFCALFVLCGQRYLAFACSSNHAVSVTR